MPNWGQGAKGAAGGALAGGSIGGPWGAAIGGAIGGIGGLWGGGGESDAEKQQRQMLMDYYSKVQGREAPQMGPAAQSGYSGFRGNQSDLIGRLEALSKGQGPSLAAQQFQQATDRNMAGQQAMASSGRGGPLGAFNAANNMGMLGANAAQGSAQARTAEQQMALQMLGQNISSGRGADEQTNMFNTGQTNEASAQNLRARLESMGMDDRAIQGILSQLGGQNAQQQGRVGMGDQILAGGAGMFAQGFSGGGGGGGGGQQALAQAAGTYRPGYPQWGAYGGPQGGQQGMTQQGFITQPNQV